MGCLPGVWLSSAAGTTMGLRTIVVAVKVMCVKFKLHDTLGTPPPEDMENPEMTTSDIVQTVVVSPATMAMAAVGNMAPAVQSPCNRLTRASNASVIETSDTDGLRTFDR